MLWQRKNYSSKHCMDSSIASDASSVVNEHVARLKKSSPFLLRQVSLNLESTPPQFHRDEIIKGSLLGEGSFCDVYEVKKISLRDSLDFTNDEKEDRAICKQDSKDRKRGGSPNYVIKHISVKVTKQSEEFCQAATDLVTEITYLSNLDHPHIVKLRGTSLGGTAAFQDNKCDSMFFLTDKVSETLVQKLKVWKSQKNLSKVQGAMLLQQKTRYAFELATALEYLHEKRIVYRDLKPGNVGFNSADKVQLFDFGLCIELPAQASMLDESGMSNSLKDVSMASHTSLVSNVDEVYHLAHAGTRRYSSPEMLAGEPYNEKTDVYSWAIVVHEILSLKKPFSEFSINDLSDEVCFNNMRPTLSSLGIPSKLKRLLSDAWEHDISKRANMYDICVALVSSTMD